MKLVRILCVIILAFCLRVSELRAETELPLNVVATLSTFGSITEEVGGDLVKVRVIAPPQFNPHFIEPRPSDVLSLKRTDLFINGGLDLEAWRGPLVDAASRVEIRPGGSREVNLGSVVKLLEVPVTPPSRSQGDIHLFGNPHYWLDPQNGIAITNLIASSLAKFIPEHSSEIYERGKKLADRISSSALNWKSEFVPYHGVKLVAYHNEWVYLSNFLGIEVGMFLEPKPGIAPSPRHLIDVEQYMRSNNVPAVIQATFYSEKAANAVAETTGAKVVKLCQNTGELPECSDYVSMLNFNVESILSALKK